MNSGFPWYLHGYNVYGVLIIANPVLVKLLAWVLVEALFGDATDTINIILFNNALHYLCLQDFSQSIL